MGSMTDFLSFNRLSWALSRICWVSYQGFHSCNLQHPPLLPPLHLAALMQPLGFMGFCEGLPTIGVIKGFSFI